MPLYEISDNALIAVKTTTFSEESILERSHLQNMLKRNIAIIAPETMILAEEYSNWDDSRRRIDLLCLDRTGRIIVVELKRTEDGNHMELQALRYAAMISRMTFSEAVKAHQKYAACSEENAESDILEFLGWDEPQTEDFANDIAIILASAEFSKELMTTVMWLSEREIDIRCMKLRPYRLENRVLVDVQKIFPLPEAEDYQVKIREKEKEERDARIQNRDTTRFDLTIDGQVLKNLPKRRLAFHIIQAAIKKGIHPRDILEENWRWTIVAGKHNSQSFLDLAMAERLDDSSRSNIRRFYTADEDLFHVDGKTYAATKMWGANTIPFVDQAIQKFGLTGISYAQTS